MAAKCAYPNIEAERARAQLTQQEIADRLGISRRTYCKYQSSGHMPVSVVIKLSDIFNCTIDYLLGLTRNPT